MPSRTRRPSDSSSSSGSNDTNSNSNANDETLDNSMMNESLREERSWWDVLVDFFGFGDEDEEVAQAVEQAESNDQGSEQSLENGPAEEQLPDILAAAEEELEETKTNAADHASDVADKVTLTEGSEYTVTASDMADSNPWEFIAKNHGLMAEKLMPFNQHIVEVSQGAGPAVQHTETTALAEGVTIYIPSAQELVFGECTKKTGGDYDAAVELYGEMEEGPNVALYTAAMERASGKVGESYGVSGVDGGSFMTENASMAGASSRKTETVDGRTEYKVFWLDEFWKCSLFMNDVVFSAGYKPAQTSNDHYSTAGRAHEHTKIYEEIPVEKARPGDCWQRFGGRGSNESHNAILGSFVEVTELDEERDQWEFTIIGAEEDRAAEGDKTKTMKKGTNETTDNKTIRFLRPRQER
jgi:hypothetical protein